jgi:hypothetical protein
MADDSVSAEEPKLPGAAEESTKAYKYMIMRPDFESEARCCMCIELKMGIYIMLFFGMIDILYMIGNVFWALYFNYLLNTISSLKITASGPDAEEHVK